MLTACNRVATEIFAESILIAVALLNVFLLLRR
jgi:hypothetical protein